MDFSNIKWVVTDLDGTLLDDNHEVSSLFLDQFHELTALGIHFVAASGRQYGSMYEKFSQIANQITFIAENGSLIRKENTTLHHLGIDDRLLVETLSLVASLPDVNPILCAADMAFVLQPTANFVGLMREYYTDYTVIHEVGQLTSPVLKVALYHPIASEKYIYPHTQSLASKAMVKVSGTHWVDVSHQNANKGYALSKLLFEQGIRPEEIVVFGDYFNDLEMLSLTPNSIAMANAHPKVKEVANYHTASNNQRGVETILGQIIAQKKALLS